MKWGNMIAIVLLLVIAFSAFHLYVQKERLNALIEGQMDCERGWLHTVTFSTMVDLQFHSKNALEALDSNSIPAFNISTVELERDFLRLLNHLLEAESYLRLDTFNESVFKMADTGGCMEFLNASRTAFLNGTANISAVREGLSLIHDFATEWRRNGNYPSEELLKANVELQEKCSALIQKVENP
ncbi:hypothetical protein [Thermococcus sp. MAR1]|uniref:hypothetical protein n=1 Tax=Thermococcus sp. MAR1 TaxID=1638263 RepID=UPI001439CBE9|nr:hypothetical protein [Thermococcus sp. MAR1]NJE09555.1 hypothetical protein [Thermococcus sp. MAR1]